jgi:hypothetical protein
VVVEELVAMVVGARELGVERDLRVTDRLETLALRLWDEVHLHLGLPRWTGVAAPSNRWVALERSVGRLHQRLDDPRLRTLQAGESTQVALRSARAAWREVESRRLRR